MNCHILEELRAVILSRFGVDESGILELQINPGDGNLLFISTLGSNVGAHALRNLGITATALGFLRPEIITALQAANVATDAEFFLVNANHFDDCNFSGGSAVVADIQARAVELLDPKRSRFCKRSTNGVDSAS